MQETGIKLGANANILFSTLFPPHIGKNEYYDLALMNI